MTAPEGPTASDARPRRRLRVLAVLFVLVLLAAAVVVYFLIPNHRTALLVDSSAAPEGFAPIRQAVSSVAANTGGADALSLRRFGGDCGAAGNTVELVGARTRAGGEISAALGAVRPGGKPTLLAGILGVIEDFRALYPFRAWTTNRIVVVTRTATDACQPNEGDVRKAVQDKVTEAGLDLEFRFVGHQVPPEQQATLTQLASTLRAPAPAFTGTTAELSRALRQVVVPRPGEATSITVPGRTTTTSAKPPVQALVQVNVVLSQFQAVVTVREDSANKPCTVPKGIGGSAVDCRFTAPAGARMRLEATVSGQNLTGRGHRGRLIWFGCDEKPGGVPENPGATFSCTLDLTRSGYYVCLATTDLSDRGGAYACMDTFRRLPRIPIPFGSTAPAPTK